MPSITPEILSAIEDWQSFYKKYFNEEHEFSQVIFPDKPTNGDWRLLVIARGMKLGKLFEQWESTFHCRFHDLHTNVIFEARTAKYTHYAIWVLSGATPDKEFWGQPYELADPERKSMTLTERIIFGLKYFDETGRHLDEKGGGTICSGTSSGLGTAPYLEGNPGNNTAVLFWCFGGARRGSGGIRQVVSF
jgi:hypothetical protein